jgi:fructokinase
LNSVYAIGETIYDIIFRDGQPVAARPGGAMLNSAVSLGRSGIKVEMITELGDDRVGRMILGFLRENGVSTNYTVPSAGFRTPVSLAFLDDQGNAEYSFYKQYLEDRLRIQWPKAGDGDVVLFGSFYSLDPAIRERLIGFVRKAKKNGAVLFYDPNIRKNHLEEIRKLMPLVEENLELAGIIRGSDEDFHNLFGLEKSEDIFRKVRNFGSKALIVTRGAGGGDLLTDRLNIHVPAKKTEIISTIGAGDAFNAGVIFGLVSKRLAVHDPVDIDEKSWKEILDFGITFATDVCGRLDNYIESELTNT